MRALFVLTFLTLLACSVSAPAQTVIHRCVSAQGQPVFTDQPCAAMAATPVLPSITRNVDEMINPVPVLCAGDRSALRQSITDAFANHDANRLAGLMLWQGYGRATAVADIRSLNKMVHRTLLDFGYPDYAGDAEGDSIDTSEDPFAQEPPVAATVPSNELVLHTKGRSGDTREARFTVVRRSGCLWLQGARGND